MIDGWIKVEPVFDGKPKKVEDMYCKVTLYDSVSIILDDEDRDYLIRSLLRHKKFKECFGKVSING